MLTGSIYMLQVYDRVLPSRSVPTLVGLSILVVVALSRLQGVFDFLRQRILSRIGSTLDASGSARRVYQTIVVDLPLRGQHRREGLQLLRDLDRCAASSRAAARRRCSICPGCRSISGSASCSIPVSADRWSAAPRSCSCLALMTEFMSRRPIARSRRAHAAERSHAGRSEPPQCRGHHGAGHGAAHHGARWTASTSAMSRAQQRASRRRRRARRALEGRSASCCSRPCSASAPGSSSTARPPPASSSPPRS